MKPLECDVDVTVPETKLARIELLVSPEVGQCPQLAAVLELLRRQLGLQPLAIATDSARFRLRLNAEGLALEDATQPRWKPLRLDFVHGEMAARLRRPAGELLRAVGAVEPSAWVVDATAGLGADSALLAAAGHRVRALERQPLVYALLADALRRAREAGLGWTERLELGLADSQQGLSNGPRPSVVYLDPMFPDPQRSARPVKGMALLQALLERDSGNQHETDSRQLLRGARAVALRRVVVKRPFKAPPLDDAGRVGTILGRSIRFDLYAPL